MHPTVNLCQHGILVALMARSDRLLQMMQCLRTLHPPVRAGQLADELNVSIRTIYRDIDALRRSGALIDGEAGYGYTLQEDPALPPMMFSRDEMEALVLGLREVMQVGDPVLAKAASNAHSKLKASLPDRMRAEFEHAVLYARRSNARPETSIDIESLRAATRQEFAIDMHYRDEQDRSTKRQVLPLAIMFFDRALVLVAWCNLRSAFRSFRIDRIEHFDVTDQSFRPRRVGLLRTYRQILADQAASDDAYT